MAQPSILDYARYFNLTKEYTINDISEQIAEFYEKRHACVKHDRDTIHRYSKLLTTFEQARQDIISSDHECLPSPPPEVVSLMNSCGQVLSPEKLSLLQGSVLSPRCKRKTKMPMPLLKIGGGNVEKDVAKIRRGIDLKGALEEVKEENRVQVRLDQTETHTYGDWRKDVLNIVEAYSEVKAEPEPYKVTESCFYFLKAAITDPLTRPEASLSVANTLPSISAKPGPRYATLSKEDFELCTLGESSGTLSEVTICEPEQSSVASPKDDSLSCSAFISTPDFVSRLDQSKAKSESEFDRVISQAFWDECINANCYADPSQSDDNRQVIYVTPQEKITSHPKSEQTTGNTEGHKTEPNSSKTDSSTSTITDTVNMTQHGPGDRLKFALPSLETVRFELKGLKMEQLLSPAFCCRVSSDTSGFEIEDLLQRLPFKLPTFPEVMLDTCPSTSTILDKHLAKLKHMISSERMLYRDPNISILAPNSGGEEDEMQLEDFPIEDHNHGTPEVDPSPSFLESSSRYGLINIGMFDFSHTSLANGHSSDLNFLGLEEKRSIQQEQVKNHNEPDMSASNHDSAQASKSQLLVQAVESDSCTLAKRKRELDADSDAASTTAKRHQRIPSTDTTKATLPEFASDTLTSFFGRRGTKFSKPANLRPSGMAELPDDPIQCTQSEKEVIDVKSIDTVPPSVQESVDITFTIPPWVSLESSRTIVLNTSLLQRKPLLIRHVEHSEPDKLTLLYRDLDIGRRTGPDIILDVHTCILITSVQALDQRPLPGQRSETELSETHDQIVRLACTYSRVIVLVHYIHAQEVTAQSKLTLATANFTAFCQRYRSAHVANDPVISPIWLPCSNVCSTPETVNAWVWQLINRYGYQNVDALSLESNAFLEEETTWELFLKRMGIQPLAAQVVLGRLRKSNEAVNLVGKNGGDWGLRRLVAMSPIEMSKFFGDILSKATIGRMINVLRSDGQEKIK